MALASNTSSPSRSTSSTSPSKRASPSDVIFANNHVQDVSPSIGTVLGGLAGSSGMRRSITEELGLIADARKDRSRSASASRSREHSIAPASAVAGARMGSDGLSARSGGAASGYAPGSGSITSAPASGSGSGSLGASSNMGSGSVSNGGERRSATALGSTTTHRTTPPSEKAKPASTASTSSLAATGEPSTRVLPGSFEDAQPDDVIVLVVVCASKALCDAFSTNGHYARVGGISLIELNMLEKELLNIIDWRLTCSGVLLQHYYSSLVRSHPDFQLAAEPDTMDFIMHSAEDLQAEARGISSIRDEEDETMDDAVPTKKVISKANSRPSERSSASGTAAAGDAHETFTSTPSAPTQTTNAASSRSTSEEVTSPASHQVKAEASNSAVRQFLAPKSGPQIHIWAVDVSEHSALLFRGGDAKDVAAELLPDEEARSVARFVRHVDRARSLVGKLLVRLAMSTLIDECRVAGWSRLRFEKEAEGRPFLAHPFVQKLDYNITHDSDWVALAIQAPAWDSVDRIDSKVGIDVMELSLPHFEPNIHSFVGTMELALTARESHWILRALEQRVNAPNTEAEALRRLYDLWTHKEAYTKAIGKGLGFDFTRLELRLWDCIAAEPRATKSPLVQPDLAAKQALIASTDRANRRGDNILHSDGVVVPHYSFTELLLPPGKAHALRREDAAPHLADLKAGEGTGAPSQLVLACGPLVGSEARASQSSSSQIAPTVELELAKAQGWFRSFTLDEIITASRTAARC
ncbi:related to bna2-tryptophan-dioxygenase [Ceraceosorus bombacis]|uniref:holo-[acyl-carrier-protein] synthase n=1 Tax=Ceraceosorus bombacis TaxID=401625 RepID=A0A0P1BCY3_9BASI|nr:related to bna2-tryptophan-dioxygenase [Ceraceosorus bombacis]